jgi:DNA-directed RNA polymerase specialized sigma24 family protein
MEHAEIAESLGISPVAARQLVHRALIDLQKILDLSH